MPHIALLPHLLNLFAQVCDRATPRGNHEIHPVTGSQPYPATCNERGREHHGPHSCDPSTLHKLGHAQIYEERHAGTGTHRDATDHRTPQSSVHHRRHHTGPVLKRLDIVGVNSSDQTLTAASLRRTGGVHVWGMHRGYAEGLLGMHQRYISYTNSTVTLTETPAAQGMAPVQMKGLGW